MKISHSGTIYIAKTYKSGLFISLESWLSAVCQDVTSLTLLLTCHQWPHGAPIPFIIKMTKLSFQGRSAYLIFLSPIALGNIKPRFLLWICDYPFVPPTILFISSESVTCFSLCPSTSHTFPSVLLHILYLPVSRSRVSEYRLSCFESGSTTYYLYCYGLLTKLFVTQVLPSVKWKKYLLS